MFHKPGNYISGIWPVDFFTALKQGSVFLSSDVKRFFKRVKKHNKTNIQLNLKFIISTLSVLSILKIPFLKEDIHVSDVCAFFLVKGEINICFFEK